jgi:hypothetical protein
MIVEPVTARSLLLRGEFFADSALGMVPGAGPVVSVDKRMNVDLHGAGPSRLSLPSSPLLSRLAQAILKRLRLAAWRVLDLHTEFNPVE